jgi:hypothetical protein
VVRNFAERLADLVARAEEVSKTTRTLPGEAHRERDATTTARERVAKRARQFDEALQWVETEVRKLQTEERELKRDLAQLDPPRRWFRLFSFWRHH